MTGPYGGRRERVSCPDSQPVNYGAIESELPLVDGKGGTTHDRQENSSTHISLLHNSPSGIPAS